jgi:outer membrane protein TolC
MTLLKKHTILFLLFPASLYCQEKTLESFISSGLANSPLLNDYRNQLQSTLLDSARINASYLPQVSATTNNSYAPVINGYGYDNAITNGTNINAVVGVNKSFVSHRNLENQYRTIRISGQGIQNTAKISEQELRRNIISQYIIVYGDQQQLIFSAEIYALLKNEDTVLKTLAQKNVYRQTDYLTFLVTLQQQQLQNIQDSIQYRYDYSTLNYICGIDDTGTTALKEPDLPVQSLIETGNSIFFRQYFLDSLKLENERRAIDLSYKPKLNAFADAGYISSLAYDAHKNFGTSIGFGISVPIYDGKQRKLQYQKLDIAEQTRQGYRQFFSKQYTQQIQQLYNQLTGTTTLLSEINRQIRYSEGLVNANMKLLMTGDAHITDLVIALNNYMTARNLLTQNTINRLQIINQINYWTR